MEKTVRQKRQHADQVALTTGSLKKALVLFAIPLFFSQLFQTLYNTADTVIIGYSLGDLSLAAVGAVASLFELMVGFCTGFGNGLGIVAAQKYGAKDMKAFHHVIGLSILLAGIASVILSIVVGLGLPSILRFMRTSPEIFDLSYSYISVICGGLIITVFYNLCAGMLRAIGDSITPLIILMISSLLNIGLDLYFITGLNMGVAGTAWATLIAQLVSLIICLIWIAFRKKELVPHAHDFAWNGAMVKNLCSMGFSMALMSSIVSAGTLILQIGINTQGTMIVSGHTAARKLLSILNLPIVAMMTALSSFVAQNIGAGKEERAEKGIAFANRIGLYYSILLTIFIFFFARILVELISGSASDEVISTGALYLRTNIPFFPVLVVLLNLRTSMQSMSLKTVPVLSSVIELAGKILFTLCIVPFTGYLGVCFTEPAVWCAMALFLAIFYLKNPVFKKAGIRTRIFR